MARMLWTKPTEYC